jgi:hypothetical protein
MWEFEESIWTSVDEVAMEVKKRASRSCVKCGFVIAQ